MRVHEVVLPSGTHWTVAEPAQGLSGELRSLVLCLHYGVTVLRARATRAARGPRVSCNWRGYGRTRLRLECLGGRTLRRVCIGSY